MRLLARSRTAARAALVLAITLGGIVAANAQGTLTLLPTTLPTSTNGNFYNQTITSVGGNAPYTFQLSGTTPGPLPPGLSISSGGVLSGTLTAAGSYTFELQATDSTANNGFRTYTLGVGSAGGINVNPGSLPDGSVSVAYSQNITTTGGTGSGRVFSTSGSLPPGLSINSGSGTISGTPTTGGTFNFTVHVIDSGGNTGSRGYTVNIGANILALSNPLPNGALTVPYNQTVTASGGIGPYTFALVSGTLPNGFTLGVGGGITGTPTVAGTFNFSLRATDTVNNVGTQAYTVIIGSNILTVTPGSQPNGAIGTAYSQNFGASGGTGGPYTFARTSGALPNGLALSSGGALTGTPSASGTFNFDVTATDGNFNTGTRNYSVTINPTPLTINPANLPAATVGTAYSQTVVASGGNGNYSYTVLSGTLPTGLSMDGAGNITGTPSAPGAFNFTVQATDTSPNTGTRNYTINVGTANTLTITPANLPNGTNGTGYSQNLTGNGGTGPYTFSLNSGALPAGLTLSAGGVISGTPSGGGSSTFVVRVNDSLGDNGIQSYTVNIGGNSLTVGPPTVTPGTRTLPYTQQMTATGGTGGPYTFSILVGSLPAGLTMNAAGLISGTPTAGGSTFTVRALDGQGNFGTLAYTMVIGTVSLVINPATLPPAMVGHAYSQQLATTGGTAPYTYSISAGALPPGLAISGAGLISGTPTSAAVATFTVQSVDVNGNVGTRAYTFTNRADPALDPQVQGLVTAQVATAQRFASAQVANITQHLETLHDHFTPCGFNFSIAPPISGAMPQQYGAPYTPQGYADPNALYSPNGQYGAPQQGYARQGYAEERAPGPVGPFSYAAADPITTSADPSFPRQPQYQPQYQQQQQYPRRMLPCASDWATSMAFWTSGSFQFGNVTPSGATMGNHFNTGGLTGGVDIRPSDSLIVGIAVGYGGDRSDVGNLGSRSDSTSLSGALYACMSLLNPFFLDAAVGYGTLDFNNHRYVTADATFADGTRKGSYWYGALKGSAELARDNVKFTPYISIDFTQTNLDGYGEQGSSAQLLTYSALKFNTLSGAVGLRAAIDIPMSFGILTPNARVEYRHTSTSSYDQAMFYNDLGPSSSTSFGQAVGVANISTASLGLRARSPGGLGVELEYSVAIGSNSYQAQAIRGAVRVPF